MTALIERLQSHVYESSRNVDRDLTLQAAAKRIEELERELAVRSEMAPPRFEPTDAMILAGIAAWNNTFGTPMTRYAAIYKAMYAEQYGYKDAHPITTGNLTEQREIHDAIPPNSAGDGMRDKAPASATVPPPADLVADIRAKYADRYRWLRHADNDKAVALVRNHCGSRLDKAIDEAMK